MLPVRMRYMRVGVTDMVYVCVCVCPAGMGSVALVLSILVPSVGNWWYLLTLLSPAAWVYYFQKGERVEQVRRHSLLLGTEPCLSLLRRIQHDTRICTACTG